MTKEEVNKILDENQKMRKTLKFILNWQLPKVECDGKMMSYECAYGSNGARDYMRLVASETLIELKG